MDGDEDDSIVGIVAKRVDPPYGGAGDGFSGAPGGGQDSATAEKVATIANLGTG
jgi:hypothetical protein